MVSTSSYAGKNPRKFLQFLTWRNTKGNARTLGNSVESGNYRKEVLF